MLIALAASALALTPTTAASSPTAAAESLLELVEAPAESNVGSSAETNVAPFTTWSAMPKASNATSLVSSLEPPMALEPTGGDGYLRIGGGLVTTTSSSGPDEDIDFDEGVLASVAFGQRMNRGAGANFSLELEGVWSDQDADDQGPIVAVQDVTVGAVFLNGVFDIPLGERASAYLGAGIGAAWVDVGTTSDAVNDFDSDEGPYLSWQARAGLEWRFASSTALYVGYLFMNIDDVDISDDLGAASFDLETQQHVIEAGLTLGI